MMDWRVRTSCSATSPKYCFYPGVPPTKGGNTTVYAFPMSNFQPSNNNSACSCVSYVYQNINGARDQFGCAPGANCTMYAIADSSLLPYFSNYFTNVQSCTTDLCNCNEPGCVDPYVPGSCPATGSAGPLQCRVGYTGTINGTTYGASTPGNLLTQTFPPGSICFKYTYSNGLTMYGNLTAASCVYTIRMGGMGSSMTAASGCNTDLCGGAPAPTWGMSPQASTSSSATLAPAQFIAAIAAAVGVFATMF